VRRFAFAVLASEHGVGGMYIYIHIYIICMHAMLLMCTRALAFSSQIFFLISVNFNYVS
jgi:hypothetical protein